MAPITNGVLVVKAVPPVAAAYHSMVLPATVVACKLRKVSPAHINCGETAVGATGKGFTVTVTTAVVAEAQDPLVTTAR